MKALRFDRFGSVSALRLVDVPKPRTREPDEVVVGILASSINPSDVKNVQGKVLLVELSPGGEKCLRSTKGRA